MTDDPHDDDLRLGAELGAQVQLYERVLDCDVTTRAIDFTARAHLLIEIADVDTAKLFVDKPKAAKPYAANGTVPPTKAAKRSPNSSPSTGA